MGACPDWYAVLRSAKYLGVNPWDLHKQPVVWQRWAQIAEAAELFAEQQASDRASRRSEAGLT